MRTLTAAIITVGLVASLAACASPGSPSGECEPTAKPGDASSLIEASGEPGTDLDISFPTPLITRGLEVSTISEGEGRTLYPGEVADFHLTAVDSKTAEVIPIQGLQADSLIRRTVSGGEGEFGRILECASVGSRLGATLTVMEAFGQAGPGLDEDDTIVLVLDVVRGFIGKANGVSQLSQNGMPNVVVAPNGQPGIVVPNETAPEELRFAVLKLGDGKKVAEGDAVVLHYTGVNWEDKSVFESTWTNELPATVFAEADPAGPVVPGLAEALIGQQVGSQVVVVVPAAEGFGEGAAPENVPAGSTLVYVFDVLGIQEN